MAGKKSFQQGKSWETTENKLLSACQQERLRARGCGKADLPSRPALIFLPLSKLDRVHNAPSSTRSFNLDRGKLQINPQRIGEAVGEVDHADQQIEFNDFSI